MKQRTIAFVVLFLTAGITLFGFQNCSENLAAGQVQTLQSTCSTHPAAQSKILIPENSLDHFDVQLPLSLLVDTQCVLLDTEDLSFFGEKIELTMNQKKLPTVALNLNLGPSWKQKLLKEEIEKSPCFLGLVNDPMLSSSHVESDMASTNDPEAHNQRHLDFTEFRGQESWQEKLTETVVVAVIDTGVDYRHTDLESRMWTNAEGEHGFNFVENNNDPMDDDGHGTHIAGLIAAQENNGFGVAGLTGDYVEIMAIKSLPSRQAGRTSDIYNGIEYAINNGADVISLSIYAEGLNPLLESAIIKALKNNILVVLAIGNQSKQLSPEDPVAPAYIGASLNGAITVASVDTISGDLSFFSNYSAQFAEIAAPGAENGGVRDQGLLSTFPGQNWGRLRGTSQAVPIVSAMGATMISFLKAKNIFYTPEMLEKLLLEMGTRSFANLEGQISHGRVINFKIMNENLDQDRILTFFKSHKQEGLCSKKQLY